MKHQRYVILVFLVGAFLAGLVVRSAAESGLASQGLPDTRILGIATTSTLAGILTGVVGFFGLLRTRRAVRFTDEVIGELGKVTWPTRDESMQATTTVIATTIFVAVLMAFYDLLWKSVADWVLFTEG
jgi:preprotein translocase SecE subunit